MRSILRILGVILGHDFTPAPQSVAAYVYIF